jgi:hypothetical protein
VRSHSPAGPPAQLSGSPIRCSPSHRRRSGKGGCLLASTGASRQAQPRTGRPWAAAGPPAGGNRLRHAQGTPPDRATQNRPSATGQVSSGGEGGREFCVDAAGAPRGQPGGSWAAGCVAWRGWWVWSPAVGGLGLLRLWVGRLVVPGFQFLPSREIRGHDRSAVVERTPCRGQTK